VSAVEVIILKLVMRKSKTIHSRICSLFKKWLVKRPEGQCQVLFSWYELDDFVDLIIKEFKNKI
jgi:hypothetical protein